MPTFKIKTPVGVNQIEMKKDILWAVAEATRAALRDAAAVATGVAEWMAARDTQILVRQSRERITALREAGELTKPCR